MAQHHLLASKSKNIALKDIFHLTKTKPFTYSKQNVGVIPITFTMFVVRIAVFATTPIFSNLANAGAASIANVIFTLPPTPFSLFTSSRWSVNHQEAFSAKGINNNLAESFNARFRDLHRGVHHKTDNKYALHYANQAAFMSGNRRKSNGELFSDVLQRCLWVLPLKEWVGYWQGNHRQGELIGMKAFAPKEISQNYFKRLEEQMKYDEMLLAA